MTEQDLYEHLDDEIKEMESVLETMRNYAKKKETVEEFENMIKQRKYSRALIEKLLNKNRIIIGNFMPKPDFNICDHCKYMEQVKDDEIPCRNCPNNTNYAYYQSLDLNRSK